MTHKLKFAIVSLHIMTGLCVFIVFAGVMALQDPSTPSGMAWFLIGFGIAAAIGNELVVRGLKQRKFWAWVISLVLGAGSILPFGVFVLYGLLAAGSRAEFGLGRTTPGQQ